MKVKIKVESTATAYQIAIDDHFVLLKNGVGLVDLPDKEHVLIWFMRGNAGNYISITLSVGDKTIFEVKKSKIPIGVTKYAHKAIFDV